MDSVYAGKPTKNEKQMKAIAGNFTEIAERSITMKKKVKQGNEAIEKARNEEAVKRSHEETETGSKDGRRGGPRQDSERQFKLPTGVLPEKISSDITPLMAQDWPSVMRLYIRTCSNLEILSRSKERTLCKRFVEPALWSHVIFFDNDDMAPMVKKVQETFDTLQPSFARKVKLLDLMIMKGEGYLEWAMRINEISDLADRDSIKSLDLKLIKYCQGL